MDDEVTAGVAAGGHSDPADRELTERDRWPLADRAESLGLVTAALAGRTPVGVVIAGPAGVGRTRLAREAMALAHRTGRPALWAAATAAAAEVPLGALSHLIPPVDVATDPLVLLQRAGAALAGEGSGPAPVLVVDDVHLLDRLSVTLLHRLAAGRSVSLVLTVRTGAGGDPAAPLWKDGLATRVELGPLDREATTWLMGRALGGPVEARTGHRVWQLTHGTPLFVREVVEDGLRSGRLRQEEGLWRWTGAVVPSARLAEIVLDELGDLEPAEWRVLELLAVAGSVDVGTLADHGSTDAVVALEHRGILVDAPDGERSLRASHALYPAVLRARMSQATVELLRERLLAGPEIRAGVLRLPARRGAASPGLGTVVRAAARPGVSVPELPPAERLQAAVDGGGHLAAHLPLVEELRWGTDVEQAAEAARRASALAGDDDDRARLAAARALLLHCGLGRREEAAEVLQSASAEVAAPGPAAVLAAADAALALFGGDVPSAVERAGALVREGAGPARSLAAAVTAVGLAVAGQPEEALETVRSGRSPGPGAQPAEERLADLLLAHAETFALCLAGRPGELLDRARARQTHGLESAESAADAVHALHLGGAHLVGGSPREAARWFAEARAGFRRLDPLGMGELAGALLALARAAVGDVDGARDALADLGRGPAAVALFAPFTALAEACVVSATGRTAEAAGLVLEAAALAARQGQRGVQVICLHAAVRLGLAAEVAAPLRLLSQGTDARVVGWFAEHARAVAAGDAAVLDELSRSAEQAGVLLLAAQLAAEAAAAADSSGARRAAADHRARAVLLARRCGLATMPAVERLSLPTLTEREQEVAGLASTGLSNQAIADQLFLSVRTVEAHLSNVYTKFGLSSRAELVGSIGTVLPSRPRFRGRVGRGSAPRLAPS